VGTAGRDTGGMHLLDDEAAASTVIDDGHRVCAAIAAVENTENVTSWATLFAMLGDPTRLSVLLAIHRAGQICETDVAVATGRSVSAVSHALRLPRAYGLLHAQRDGKPARYR